MFKKFLHFLNALPVLLVFFSPETILGNWVQLFSFILFLIIQRNRIIIYKNIGTFLFLITFLLSLLGSILAAKMGIPYDSLLKNIIILFFFLLFPINYNLNVLNFKFLLFLCSAIALSQFIVIFDINPFNKIINTIYLENGRLQITDNMTYFLEQDFRSSGFITNPNETAKFLTVILSTYMIVCISTTKLINNLIFFSIYFISIMLTGSRSGFIITIIIVLSYLFFIKKVNKVKKAFLILGILCIAVLFSQTTIPFRSVMLQSGFESSLKVKMDFLINYLDHLDKGFVFLFGNFYAETVGELYPQVFTLSISFFDADIGYFIYAFGFLGLIALIFKIKDIFYTTEYSVILLPVFLWFFTASIFFYFRFFIFFIIITSLAISHQKALEKKIIINDDFEYNS